MGWIGGRAPIGGIPGGGVGGGTPSALLKSFIVFAPTRRKISLSTKFFSRANFNRESCLKASAASRSPLDGSYIVVMLNPRVVALSILSFIYAW